MTKKSLNALELTKAAEAIGLQWVCIHGRTREQMFSGQADRKAVAAIKQKVNIPVLYNGDIFTAADAKDALEETGCDGILIGRGAMGNPWLFREIVDARQGKEIREPDNAARLRVIEEHIDRMVVFKGGTPRHAPDAHADRPLCPRVERRRGHSQTNQRYRHNSGAESAAPQRIDKGDPMKRKSLVIILCILLSITTGASAMLASLDEALSPLIDGQSAVRMSVQLTLNSLMPYDDTLLAMLNRVLQHTRLDMLLDGGSGDTDTGFALSVGGDTLLEMKEQRSEDAYLLQTSLLPNRMLFSTQASPVDTLLASSQEEPAEDAESLDPNTSKVEEAFDMLAAVTELQSCYRDLIDQTVLLTEKNNVSYSIDNIGKGRTSYVAKLTSDQSTELLPELRAVISCGMDAEYREEIAQITFVRGFTVALYQNADGEDICVYMRGTILYPDGDRRKLKWQWAFTPEGETQTFLHQVSRESGRRDTRNIEAILERSEGKDGFTLACETYANLRRGGMNEKSTLTIDLTGSGDNPVRFAGSVIRETSGTYNGDNLDKRLTTVDVELSLLKADSSVDLTGTAAYKQMTNKLVNVDLALNFLQTAQTTEESVVTAQGDATAVEISILPADTDLAQQTAQTPTETAEETQPEKAEFLVGSTPVGLYEYEIPAEPITINMDTTQRKVHQSLMNEAAQRLAGNLVLAVLNLPAEDREILSDGMTEMDYAIFLAMLD